ncbi:MAG: alpha/beta hydrolase [Planctomycetaceae bacterium]|nr:alpha/beta hydrolase [Planctomycetaceae bacterium]
MKQLAINGTTLSVVDEGEGHPVLLVHGFPLSHSMWSAQIEVLSAKYRVIAPDLRGFGQNESAAGKLTMEQFADDLAAILDELQIEQPVTYCGLSMGGYIFWDFWRRHADRLNSVILCDTRAVADEEDKVRNRHKMAASVLNHGPEACARIMLPGLFAEQTDRSIVASLEAVILATPPESIAAALGGMAERADSAELQSKIDVPTLIIVGEHDKISTASEMRSMADEIPDCDFLEVPGAGHMVPMEKPELVNEAILAFLNRF